MTQAPKHVTIEHKGQGKSVFSGWGVVDMTKPFRADYVRKDIADRSPQEHGRAFAEINNMYDTLPESMSEEPFAKSANALRKHALIQTGYCEVLAFHYEDRAQAERMGATTKASLFKLHGYALGAISGSTIVFKVPHSQSKSAMGHAAFHESVTAVENWIKELLENDDMLKIAGTG